LQIPKLQDSYPYTVYKLVIPTPVTFYEIYSSMCTSKEIQWTFNITGVDN